MIKTPMQKNTELKGQLMGQAAIAGGWTHEMKEEHDYLDACFGELLAPAGTFTGKPNVAREKELGDLMEAGVYRSLYDLETKGTEGDRIFDEMRAQIETAKVLKDPLVRDTLEQLLRIGHMYLGLNNYLASGSIYEAKPLLPRGADYVADRFSF